MITKQYFHTKWLVFLGILLFSGSVYAQIPAADFVLEVNKSISAGDTGINMFEFNAPGATSIKVYDDAAGSNLLATFNPMGANEFTIDLSGVALTTVFIAYEGPLTQATISANAEADAEKIINIIQWGTSNTYTRLSFEGSTNLIDIDSGAGTPNFGSASLNSTFRSCPNFTNANNNLDSWTTTTITDMGNMFNGASSFEGNLSGWATLNVTSMTNMFRDAGNFSNDGAAMSWDVGNVTAFSGMFFNAVMFNADISMWNIGTTNGPVLMNNMFRNVPNFNQDISNWDVDAVTDFGGMFLEATSFNADISGWQTGSAISMSSMFRLANAFNRDLSSWDVSNVTNMSNMFNGASAFTNGNDNALNTGTGRTGINGWDVSSVTSFSNMFQNTLVFNRAIGDWQIRNDGAAITPISMNSMFSGAAMFDQDLSAWTMSSVTNVGGMFRGAVDFNNGTNDNTANGIDDWDVSAAISFSSMFAFASKFNRDIGDWRFTTDSMKSINMLSMFQSANAFDQDLSEWNVGRVFRMQRMFLSAAIFNNGDNSKTNGDTGRSGLNGWDVSNVIDMSIMFQQAPMFNRFIDSWNVEQVLTMQQMFANASSFNQNLVSWNPISVANFAGFLSNTALTQSTYDQFLIAWADKDLVDGVDIGVFNLRFCTGEPARTRLNDEQSVTFNGDSKTCSPGASPSDALFWQSAGSIDGVANNGEVTQWSDLSAAGLDFTATTGTAGLLKSDITSADIINFNPVVNFDGTNDYMITNFSNPDINITLDRIGSTTFFVVYKELARANNQVLTSFNKNGTATYLHYAPNSSNEIQFSGTSLATDITNSNTLDMFLPDGVTPNPNYIDPVNLTADTFGQLGNSGRVVTHLVNQPVLLQYSRFRGTGASGDGIVGSGLVGSNGSGYSEVFENAQIIGSRENFDNTDDGLFTRTTNIFLGAANASNDFFYGDIAEVLAFQNVPNLAQRNAINTYFALKYSVEMDIDYLAAYDNTVTVWSRTDNTGFTNNVFGMGRDDIGAFNQRVSKPNPNNTDAILTISTSDDFTTLSNDASRTDFTTDQTYVVIGNNGEATPLWTSANSPDKFQTLNRIWKSQVTGTPDPVFMQFDVDDAEFDVPPNQTTDIYIVVDTDNDGDFSNETPQLLSNGGSGDLWSGAVTLANGNQFTLATTFINSPGGVSEDLELWLRADIGTLNAGIEVANGTINEWQDQAINNAHATQATGANNPDVITLGNNFNPTISFARANQQHFALPAGFSDFTNGLSTFITATTSTPGHWERFYELSQGVGAGSGDDNIAFNRRGTTDDFTFLSYDGSTQTRLDATMIQFQTPNIYEILQQGGTAGTASPSTTAYRNSLLINTSTNVDTPKNETRTVNYVARSVFASDAYYEGTISEIILYHDDIPTYRRHRVQSYLALKYGITLDQTTGQDYFASDWDGSTGTKMWDAATATAGYDNNIFGIGTDEVSRLNQKISNSINDDALVIASLNENMVLSNLDATRTEALQELNFLTFANNGVALDWSNVPANRAFNCICSNVDGLNRVWEVTEVVTALATDAENDVYIGIPANKLGRDTTPVGTDPLRDLTVANNYETMYMLIDRAATANKFADNTFEIVEMVLDTDGIYRTVDKIDLDDNDRFTFAFIKSTPRMRHGKNTIFDRSLRSYKAGN